MCDKLFGINIVMYVQLSILYFSVSINLMDDNHMFGLSTKHFKPKSLSGTGVCACVYARGFVLDYIIIHGQQTTSTAVYT